MALVDPAKIRNMAVVGHRGAGKTSLVEALLFTSGAKNRLGNVMDGTTTMDHDEDEIRRQMTISSGLAHVEWNKHKFNLIDTPGEASFINDALGALAVVESALMVVNTVAKVEVQTERLWKLAAELGVARMAVLNMMDRERAFFAEAVASLQDHFGVGAVPVAIPIGEEGGFKGVVDLLTMKAFLYPDSSGRGKEQEIPADLLEAAAGSPGETDRSHCRGGRRLGREVPRRGGTLGGGGLSCAHQGGGGGSALSDRAVLGHQEHRYRHPAGFHRDRPAFADCPCTHRGAGRRLRRGGGHFRPDCARIALHLQDDLGSILRTHQPGESVLGAYRHGHRSCSMCGRRRRNGPATS